MDTKSLNRLHRALLNSGLRELKALRREATDVLTAYIAREGDGPLAPTLKRIHWALRAGNDKQLLAIRLKAANTVKAYMDLPAPKKVSPKKVSPKKTSSKKTSKAKAWKDVKKPESF